jgi:mannose-1-phosphate guanylyltransferase
MLYAVVMAGGIGERFWPLSTPRRPKQLIPFFEEKPLLVKAIERLDPILPIERVIIITSRVLEGPIRELIPALPEENLILEPIGKNTAPAAALATLKVLKMDPDGVVAMFPSDHFIEGKEEFHDQLLLASLASNLDYIVTFGIRPDYPATGYGYVRLGEPLEDFEGTIHHVGAFVEKPDINTARKYMEEGGYLWNSGIFVWGGKFFLDQVEEYTPDIYSLLKEIEKDLNTPAEKEALDRFYSEVEKISVDYAIMERSGRILIVPATFQWDDLGSWSALERVIRKDEGGNVVVGKAILNDVRDSIVYSEDGVVALLGVKDIVVVRMGGVTMVCHKDRVEDVRKLAEESRNEKRG